jgi:hypothetical protein
MPDDTVEVINKAKNKSEATVLKARALGKLKRYAEAAALLTSTLPFYTLLGQKYIPLMYLGKIFKDQGNNFLAKTNLKLAAEHKPLFGSAVNQFIAFYEYADLLDQLGDGEKALEFYKKADKACKIPWSPPSNKYIAKEYRALIDEAWTIQVAVSEESAKDDMPVEQIVLSPNETVIVKLTGVHLDGSVKQIFANKLDIDIPLNAGFIVQEKYQSGNSVIVKFRCKENRIITKDKINTLIKYDCGNFNKIRNFNIITENEILKINKEKSTRFFVLRDDIEDQEVKIKIVYDIQLPVNFPTKDNLILEITDSKKNLVFIDYNLPLVSGENQEYIWDGCHYKQNDSIKKYTPISDVYNIKMRIGYNGETSIDVSLVKVTPYISKPFDKENILDDWKDEEGNQSIAPKYMFGVNNPIILKVTGLNDKDFLGITDMAIKIKSESEKEKELFVNIKKINLPEYNFEFESTPNIFLGEKTITNFSTSNPTIKVEDEEFLTFFIKRPKIYNASEFEWVECSKVLVDRAEYGLEWMDYENDLSPDFYLPFSEDCAKKFNSFSYKENPFEWWENFIIGNKKCKKSHFLNGSTNEYSIDGVDFGYFIGHGNLKKPSMLFYSNDLLERSEMGLGFIDNEWLIIEACRFMRGYTSEKDEGYLWNNYGKFASKSEVLDNISGIMHGNHILLGFKTYYLQSTSDNTIWPGFLEKFVDSLKKGDELIDAWKTQFFNFYAHDDKSKITRILFQKSCVDDVLFPTDNKPLRLKRDISEKIELDFIDVWNEKIMPEIN